MMTKIKLINISITSYGDSLVAQMVKNLPAIFRRPGFHLWVGKILWGRKWQPTPVFLPGKSHGQRRLAGYSPWGCKELDRTEQLHSLTTSCSYFVDIHVCVCVYGKNTFKIYPLRELQVYSTVWLTTITMMFVRSQELILCINESLYSLTNSSLFPPTHSPKQPLLLSSFIM